MLMVLALCNLRLLYHAVQARWGISEFKPSQLAGWWFSMRHKRGALGCVFEQDTGHIHAISVSTMLVELVICNLCLLDRVVQAGLELVRRTITELRNLERRLSSGTLQTSYASLCKQACKLMKTIQTHHEDWLPPINSIRQSGCRIEKEGV
jgi:hypothetical protein